MNFIALIVPFLVNIFFQGGRLLFTSLVTCWWILNGTYSRVRLRSLPGNYHVSAHVQDIWLRYGIDELSLPSRAEDFWLTHNRFDHPETVLRDNVTLFSITDDEAVFVETEHTVDVTESGFFQMAQRRFAKHLVSMPIASFHQLANRVGDPSGVLIFISYHPRSGSTLMTKFFTETGHCLCYSEPYVIKYLAYASVNKTRPKEELQKSLKSCIRMLCKPRKGKTYAGYVFKPQSPNCFPCIPLASRTFPAKSRFLFCYRNGLPASLSTRAIIEAALPIWHMMEKSANVSPSMCRFFCEWGIYTMSSDWLQPATMMVRGALLWIEACTMYHDFRRQGIDIQASKYEDFEEIGLRHRAAAGILRHVGLSEELAEDGFRALDNDSQKNSPVSRATMGQYKFSDMSREDERRIDEFADKHGLPRIREDCVLEGTLTR